MKRTEVRIDVLSPLHLFLKCVPTCLAIYWAKKIVGNFDYSRHGSDLASPRIEIVGYHVPVLETRHLVRAPSLNGY